MAMQLVIGPPEALEETAQVLADALHFPAALAHEFMGWVGPEHCRSVVAGGRVVAAIVLAPMGQWFGGRRVPTIGICGVGVRPEWRGSGVGTTMLRSALAELHARGEALATLYPATLQFYERAGFARAGQRLTYEAPTAAIDLRAEGSTLVPLAPGEEPLLYACYNARARHGNGNLDRPAWMWRRRLEPAEQPVWRFRVAEGELTSGYVVFTQGGRSDPLTVHDVCALTPAAGRRILTLFGGYRSMVERLTWNGGPFDPLRYLLREELVAGKHTIVQVTRALDWMLRIVDLPTALSLRGYPAGLQAELELAVSDEWLAANNGNFRLTVAEGRGRVERGGTGRIKLGIRELAALYSGFMAPAELAAVGEISGPLADLELAGAVFAGPRPWLADMF